MISRDFTVCLLPNFDSFSSTAKTECSRMVECLERSRYDVADCVDAA